MRILSLCTSAGLWDKAHVLAGHHVIPGCEIMQHKRDIYSAFIPGGESHLTNDLRELPQIIRGMKFDGIIGGIPCQSRSRMKSFRDPKFGDLLEDTLRVLDACQWDWALLENVLPMDVPGFEHSKLDAMNYGRPHQGRPRWFTHSPNLRRPPEEFPGTVDDLMAYPVVMGRVYGPKRGAILQGWPEFAALPFPCAQLQEALADGVHRGVAEAWIKENF